MTNGKPVGEMTEQEWQERLHELASKKVDHEMGLESVAIIGFIGSALMHVAGFGLWGLIFAVIGFLLYLRMIQKVIVGERYWKLILSILISTAVAVFAIIRLF